MKSEGSVSMVALAAGLSTHNLGEELVVFSPNSQRILVLNQAAKSIFRGLESGRTRTELTADLTALGIGNSGAEWVEDTLRLFGIHGLLSVSGVTPKPESDASITPWSSQLTVDFQPSVARTYKLLDVTLRVRFGHPSQVRLVNSVIGHLSVNDQSDNEQLLDLPAMGVNGQVATILSRDGSPFALAPRLSMLAPLVKAALWKAAVDSYDFALYLHAGVVTRSNGATLLPAAAGSGKSSLTTALAHSGFDYYSDEIALLRRSDLCVPPVPLAICSKSTGWHVLERYYPGIRDLPTHAREDEKIVKYIPPPISSSLLAPVPVRKIIFPKYDPALTEFRPLGHGDALQRLFGECLASRLTLNSSEIQRIVHWIQGIDCYSLAFSSLEQAVGIIQASDSVEEVNG